jgi:hypothetical protein
MAHGGHGDRVDVDVSACMAKIRCDEVEKWSSLEKIDDAPQSAATATGVTPTRVRHEWHGDGLRVCIALTS